MTKEELFDTMEGIDDRFIDEAAIVTLKKKQPAWIRMGTIAACLCLVVVGTLILHSRTQANTIQEWNSAYTADDYFRFCKKGANGNATGASCLDTSAIPYAESRFFSDRRSEFEASEVIPVMESHPVFTCAARYNEDGSLYCVELLWSRRSSSGLEDYSDLKIVAGMQEVPSLQDCVSIEVDDDGNVLDPAVTVTERDGVHIIAEGRDKSDKTLTFETENGWYQISGSWNDSFDSVVELFEWFWEHPIDLAQFPITAGDNYTFSTLTETPEAFAEYLPDFEAFGFIEESSYVSLKNGNPIHFEGHYVAHVKEENVRNQDYYDVDGYTTIHWCILGEPNVYDLDDCLGDIGSLTRQQVIDILTKNDNKIKFTQDDYLVIIYPSSEEEAWQLIESIQ